MALSREERARFLAEPHTGALSVDAGPGRAPLTVPIWYQYAPGGELWILTGAASRKAELIRAAGRFTLMADTTQPSVRYVSVEGPVVSWERTTREQLTEMSARYLPADKVEGYVEWSWKEHGEQTTVRMRPERWLSADMGTV
ncbi:pyridoxamine 5'-phosphate oxidase family protein [Streptomyces sp. NPDC091272]|uniref:pyridoxamine 5'-phosphate oxidase family protein n=1 Tax=Streptomyces sp. NPDC091272 TaxID=3365981 RepID=UPI003829286F